VAPLGGTARVKLPGRQQFQPLTEPLHLGVSAVVDATHARVVLFADRDGAGTVQTAEMGGDLFTPRYMREPATASQGAASTLVTDLKLPDATGCPVKGRQLRVATTATGRAQAARRKRPRFRIKKKGGRFRSSNKDVQGAGLGSEWTTQGSCDGTLVGVQSGNVRVTDRHLRRPFLVPIRQAFLVARPGTVEAKAQRVVAPSARVRGLTRFAGRTSKGQPVSVRITRGGGTVRRIAVRRDLECRLRNIRSVRRGTLQLGTFRVRRGRVFAGTRRARPALDSLVRSGRVAVNGRLIRGGSRIRAELSERLTLRDGTRCQSGHVSFVLGSR